MFVASFMVPQYLNGSLPLAYAVFYLSLDTLIAGCTFVIWYCETENASAIQLAKDMMKLTFSGLPRRKSSVVVVICGAIQVSFFGNFWSFGTLFETLPRSKKK